MSTAQLAMAWVLAKKPGYVPIPGAKTIAQLKDALAAQDKPLSAADVTALEQIIPRGAIAGDRYAPEQMRHLDHERRATRAVLMSSMMRIGTNP